MESSLLAFVQDAALLLAVGVVFDVTLDRKRTATAAPLARVVVGAMLAVIGVAIMLTPFQFAPGVFFDTRTVLLTVAGLYFGPLASLVPVAAMMLFRVAQGGAGAPAGVVVLLVAWLLGVAWQRWRGDEADRMTLREMAAFGLLANAIVLVVAGLGLAATLPLPVAQDATAQLVLPSLVVNPAATALLGGLLRNRLRARQLMERNERLQAEVERQLEEVRASRARIVAAGYEERKQLERDIHDGAQQRLVGLALTLRLLRSRIPAEAPMELVTGLDRAREEARAALTELRDLARGIHPQVLTDAGIGAAVESLADRSPVPVRLTIETDRRFDPAVESAAYFVVSEALTNVAKYAEAGVAAVHVAEVPAGALRVEVRDDGVGGANTAGGTGLRGLADRLAGIDGTLDVISPDGGGTSVIATIPLRSTPANQG